VLLLFECRAEAMVNAALAPDASFAVALCNGERWVTCSAHCGGTLIAPNLVLTSRHCADTEDVEQLNCRTYRFRGELVPPARVWVTSGAQVSSTQKYSGGKRWWVPLSAGCGHDLALLELDAPLESAIALPLVAHDAVERSRDAGFDLYGYGGTGDAAGSDSQRRHVHADVFCVAGLESCSSITNGEPLFPGEFVVNANVCAGDSGGGAFDTQGSVLGTLARSVGSTQPCSYGVYTRLSGHTLLIARAARAAAEAGAYPAAAWVANAERSGNSRDIPARSFGSPCDGDEECESGLCRSDDEGLTWSCVSTCSGCRGRCRSTPAGDFCFAESSPPPDDGCRVGHTSKAQPAWLTAGSLVALTLHRLLRRRRR
jgi:hypothetical protein